MRPQRVLHCLGGMNRGGIETWLMHLLRTVDRGRIEMDFLVHMEQPCDYDEEVGRLGARIFRCTAVHRPWQFAPEFRRLLRREGPYDVVHSHMHHYSGLILRLACQCGVARRIAHSHTDTRLADRRARPARRAY
jgi:hypothetical protein